MDNTIRCRVEYVAKVNLLEYLVSGWSTTHENIRRKLGGWPKIG